MYVRLFMCLFVCLFVVRLLVCLRAHADCTLASRRAPAAVDARVAFGMRGTAFGLAVEMDVSLPGMDKAAAADLVDTAHQVCAAEGDFLFALV